MCDVDFPAVVAGLAHFEQRCPRCQEGGSSAGERQLALLSHVDLRHHEFVCADDLAL